MSNPLEKEIERKLKVLIEGKLGGKCLKWSVPVGGECLTVFSSFLGEEFNSLSLSAQKAARLTRYRLGGSVSLRA